MHLGEIAAHIGGRLLGEDSYVSGIEPIFRAGREDLSVLAWPKDIRRAKYSHLGGLLISTNWAADYADEIPSSLIVTDDLIQAFNKLSMLLDRGFLSRQPKITKACIHETAQVNSKACIGEAHIGPHSIISAGAVISDDVVIGSNCYIGPGVFIASKSRLGDNNNIGANSIIGSDAFATFEDQILPSLGRVHLAHNIRLGALCSVDRGLLGTTVINNNCLLDNQVHLGHDVELSQKVIIAAQSGLAGFVQIGEGVTLGGQAGVLPHVVIGAHARVSAKTLVHKRLKPYGICSGNPGLAHGLYLRAYKQNTKSKSGI